MSVLAPFPLLTKEKTNKIVDELIKKGELSKNESKKFIVDLLNKAEQEKDKLLERIKPEIKHRLKKWILFRKNIRWIGKKG